MKNPGTKNSRTILLVSTLCLTFLILIWISYFRQQSFDRQATIAFAINRNSNLAIALEQYTIRTIHYADAVLQMVRVQYSSEGASLNIEKLLASTNINKDIIKEVILVDRFGRRAKLSTDQPSDTANISASDYFSFHKNNSKDSLLISKPVFSGAINKPVIIVSRRITDKHGRFKGVVALQIEPRTFTSFYAKANFSKNSILSLISPDGITYARRTGPIESYGEDIGKSPLFTHVANNDDSFYFARDAIRGMPSWFSYRKLKQYPIIATVGSPEQDILARYYTSRQRYLVPRIITSVVFVLFSILICLVLIHRRKMSERLLQEETRYQHLLTEQIIAAQETERAHIGRELHDNVNQVLTTVKLYLEMALNRVETKDQFVYRSIQLVNGSIIEIRNLSHQLSAPTLGTGSLADAINALIEMVVSSTGLLIDYDQRGCFETLIMAQKLALYRIVQEQLNNIIKHAGATKVGISIRKTGTHTILEVKDNGKGFDIAEKSYGIGLNNIISRAKLFGGNAAIESAPQRGCKLKVSLPLVFEKEKTDNLLQ